MATWFPICLILVTLFSFTTPISKAGPGSTETTATMATTQARTTQPGSTSESTISTTSTVVTPASPINAATSNASAVVTPASPINAATSNASTVVTSTSSISSTTSNATTSAASTVVTSTSSISSTTSNATTSSASTVSTPTSSIISTASNATTSAASTVATSTSSISSTTSNATTSAASTVSTPTSSIISTTSNATTSTASTVATSAPLLNTTTSKSQTITNSTATTVMTTTPSVTPTASKSPIATNSTPSPVTTPHGGTIPNVLINEVYLGKTSAEDYVELKGDMNVTLTDIVLVTLAGQTIEVTALTLDNGKIASNGFYFINATTPAANKKNLSLCRSANKSCAVALYSSAKGVNVTNFTELHKRSVLLDFVMYKQVHSAIPSDLMKVLAGNLTTQTAIRIVLGKPTSISRCLQIHKQIRAYWLMTPTPNAENKCQPPTVIISEIYLGSPSYVELYDNGAHGVSLNPFVLVSFNGASTTALPTVIDLWNQVTDEKGYYILGVKGENIARSGEKLVDKSFFKNDSNAISLSKTPPFALDPVNRTNWLSYITGMVDVVIYGSSEDAVSSLISSLTPDQGFVNTQSMLAPLSRSITRCFYCGFTKTAEAFTLSSKSPSAVNTCNATYISSLHSLPTVLINEISCDQSMRHNEFIELKATSRKSVDLRGYVVVLFNGTDGKSYYSRSLEGYKTDKNGFFILGEKSHQPDVVFNSKTLVDDGIGAVALYDGRGWGCLAQSKKSPFRNGILDSLVYSVVDLAKPIPKSFVDNFTGKDGKAFIQDRLAYRQNVSISRCATGVPVALSASQFTVAIPTPKSQNQCPKKNLSKHISFKLKDANCAEFMKDKEMLQIVTSYVITGVNGLTAANVKSYKFTCGSVILEIIVVGTTNKQLDLIVKNYRDFVKRSKTVTFGNKTYTVDNTCFENCRPVNPPGGGPNSNVTVAVVVTCVAVFLVIVLIVVMYMKRKRRGIAHFRMARFDAEDENLTSGDTDDFVGGEQASFSNPLYFRT